MISADLAVGRAPGGAPADPDGARLAIDADAVHAGDVDHHSVVDRTGPGDAVTAAADGHAEPVLTREVDEIDHVRSAGAHRDDGRALVEHPVPQLPSFVIGLVGGSQQVAAESLLERREALFIDACLVRQGKPPADLLLDYDPPENPPVRSIAKQRGALLFVLDAPVMRARLIRGARRA